MSLAKIIELCQRRGWIYPAMGGTEAYVSGVRGLYDYGPLGMMLKKNLVSEWYRDMILKKRLVDPARDGERTRGGSVHTKRYVDILPLETSILGSRRLYETSGHVEHFEEALMDDYLSKERFRVDKAREVRVDEMEDGCRVIKVTATDNETACVWKDMIEKRLAPGCKLAVKDDQVWLYVESVVKPKDETSPGELVLCPSLENQESVHVIYRGVSAPSTNSPFVTERRKFNLMFQTFLGAVDPIASTIEYLVEHRWMSKEELTRHVEQQLREHLVYMRPETAQGTYLQYVHCMESYGLKLPFGLAQTGRSFRNEISPEHYIFRTTEFEQMELQFFVHPENEPYWFDYWRQERMAWWRRLLNHPQALSERVHERTELAHYARACVDIDYAFPFGRGEIEGIASRTDVDLRQHARTSGCKLELVDEEQGKRFYPFIIEPAAGLNRGMLAILHDAFTEEQRGTGMRTILKLHPRLAPFKAAVLPLTRSDRLVQQAQSIAETLWKHEWPISYDERHTIGKRYARHDEIGTPYCITIDHQTLEDGTVTVRDRDTTHQERIHKQELESFLARILEK